MEKPIFFDCEAGQLFGILHLPDEAEPVFGVLMLHPFGEEKLWSHRVFVNFAREAARRGIAVLRFDYFGHGDSDGHSEECGLDDYLDCISSAENHFRYACPSVESIDLLGLRFGAALAAIHAARRPAGRRLILWEPVVDGKRYMQELLRINLSTQLAVYGSVQQTRESLVEEMKSGSNANVDGYLIKHRFFAESSDINLLDTAMVPLNSPTLVVQIAPNLKQKNRDELTQLTDRYACAEFVKVEEPPFWREIKPFTSRASNLVDASLCWLAKADA